MISVPLYFFLLAYCLFLIVFTIFSLINLSQIFQTGGITWVSLCVTVIIAVLTVLTFFVTWTLLRSVNWTDAWQFNNWFAGGINTIF